MKAEGIELLPIGRTIIATKQLIDWDLKDADVERLAFWKDEHPWRNSKTAKPINELRITRGAYPAETFDAMGRFLAASEQEGERVKAVLFFALLCILENISYTRKDGQYLRWDYRSGRRQGKKIFDKGEILAFDKAITDKLHQIVDDLRSGELPRRFVCKDSLESGCQIARRFMSRHFAETQNESYDCLITSPPYCNRYDYTRTYALELALLGVDEEGLVKIRQEMLSCTVENRAKDLLAVKSPMETSQLLPLTIKSCCKPFFPTWIAKGTRPAQQRRNPPHGARLFLRDGLCHFRVCACAKKRRAAHHGERQCPICRSKYFSGHHSLRNCRATRLRGRTDSCPAEWKGKQQPANGRAWSRCFTEVRVSLAKDLSMPKPYQQHLKSSKNLETTYEAVRAGFVALHWKRTAARLRLSRRPER